MQKHFLIHSRFESTRENQNEVPCHKSYLCYGVTTDSGVHANAPEHLNTRQGVCEHARRRESSFLNQLENIPFILSYPFVRPKSS